MITSPRAAGILSRPLGGRALLALGLLGASLSCGSPQVEAGGGSGPVDVGGASDGGAGGDPGMAGDAGFVFVVPPSLPPELDAGPTVEKNCGLQKQELKVLTPDLMLLLDRSNSMRMRVPGGQNSKWVEVTSALDEAVKKTEGSVHWGLKTYPANTECVVPSGVEVPVAPRNYGKMSSTIMDTEPSGSGTPTQLAVRRTTEYLKSVPSKNARFILLATDGYPNCRSGKDSQPDAEGAVAAVKAAADAGIRTFVVGVSTGTGPHTVLNQMAEAGGMPRAGETKYFAVASREELLMALGSITSQVTSCTFALEKKPPSPDDVAVDLEGARVPRDMGKVDGWDYTPDQGAVLLHGSFCERLKSGGGKVDIIFGCPGVVIP